MTESPSGNRVHREAPRAVGPGHADYGFLSKSRYRQAKPGSPNANRRGTGTTEIVNAEVLQCLELIKFDRKCRAETGKPSYTYIDKKARAKKRKKSR